MTWPDEILDNAKSDTLQLVIKGIDNCNGSNFKDLALWCGPRIASLPLPRYVVRGD